MVGRLGVAARLHGSPSLTRDVDICHSRSPENLENLADVLRSLHARLRGVDEDVPFLLDARTLQAGGSVTLFDGQPLRYGKPGWENPHFICRGAPAALT